MLCMGEVVDVSGVWASPEEVGECKRRSRKGRAETGGAKVQKTGEVLLLPRVDDPQLCFISPRVTVARLVFVMSWVFIFLIPVLCSHFSWFALVLTPSFSPPTFPFPLISHSHCGMCLSVCVAACARPPHMVPFHSCVDCAPPLQISEVSESPHHRCSFILPGLILFDTQTFISGLCTAQQNMLKN